MDLEGRRKSLEETVEALTTLPEILRCSLHLSLDSSDLPLQLRHRHRGRVRPGLGSAAQGTANFLVGVLVELQDIGSGCLLNGGSRFGTIFKQASASVHQSEGGTNTYRVPASRPSSPAGNECTSYPGRPCMAQGSSRSASRTVRTVGDG